MHINPVKYQSKKIMNDGPYVMTGQFGHTCTKNSTGQLLLPQHVWQNGKLFEEEKFVRKLPKTYFFGCQAKKKHHLKIQ